MMMNFISRFGMDLENMIRLKTSLGGSESTYLSRAHDFDRFCSEHYPDAEQLTKPLALSWLKENGKASGVILTRLTFARGFAVYLNSIGKASYVLPERFASGHSVFVPYIFTDEELSALFREIDLYQYPKDPFRPILLSVYFRLTYTCGLRPNEGRNLKKQDVDLDTGEIQILNTKMQKSRIVVMSDDMLSMTRTYMTLRDTARFDSEYLFPAPDGKPYTAALIQKQFKYFFSLSNPDIPQEFLPPVRVYDLRHRFATAVLNRWIDDKKDVNSRLPYLRTYMGHRDIAATAYYIHLLPEHFVKSAGIDWESMGQIFPRAELWEK
jgi:integrase/recombinase XerD